MTLIGFRFGFKNFQTILQRFQIAYFDDIQRCNLQFSFHTTGDINKNTQMLPSICYLALAFALK
jgi:hypothetical protein